MLLSAGLRQRASSACDHDPFDPVALAALHADEVDATGDVIAAVAAVHQCVDPGGKTAIASDAASTAAV